MTKFVSFLAIAAFVLSVSSVEAAKKKTPVATASAPAQKTAPQNSSRPKNVIYEKGSGTAARSMGCKMSARC